jgi:hypothetical protein
MCFGILKIRSALVRYLKDGTITIRKGIIKIEKFQQRLYSFVFSLKRAHCFYWFVFSVKCNYDPKIMHESCSVVNCSNSHGTLSVSVSPLPTSCITVVLSS